MPPFKHVVCPVIQNDLDQGLVGDSLAHGQKFEFLDDGFGESQRDRNGFLGFLIRGLDEFFFEFFKVVRVKIFRVVQA